MALKLRVSWDKNLCLGNDVREAINITLVHRSKSYDDKGFEIYKTSQLSFQKWTEYDFKSYPTYPYTFYHSLSESRNHEYCFNMTNSSIAGSKDNPDIFEYLVLRVDICPNDEWLKITDFSGDIEVQVILFLPYPDYFFSIKSLKVWFILFFDYHFKLHDFSKRKSETYLWRKLEFFINRDY